MTLKARVKAPILLFGDVLIFYCSLILLLFVRYGEFSVWDEIFVIHAVPFTTALIGWILIFYIGGLYENPAFKNTPLFKKRFFSLLAIGGVLLIMLLYFVPQFGIAPKANLFIFIGIYAVCGYAWRFSFNSLLKLRWGGSKNRIALVGGNPTVDQIADYIKTNPQLDYEVVLRLKDGFEMPREELQISAIVIPSRLQNEPKVLRLLYEAYLRGIEVIRISDFYEQIFEKVPLPELDENWLLQNLPRETGSYQMFGYLLESLLAIVLLLILLPLLIMCGLAVKLTSHGPVLYRQPRVGQYENIFNLYKFRSMYSEAGRNPDAQGESATWSSGKDDARVTPIGRFLRASHIDEFPQLFNILSGNMSFIGPRPERPEFTKQLEKEIPYYELRNLLKPGITGWAQLNYKYGASVADAYQKLQYDIYYVKNRSLGLDLKIFLKSIKKFFV